MTSVPAGKASTSTRPPPGLVMRVLDPLMLLFDRVIDPLQRRIGVKGMAYVFVLPNLIIFAIFILFPMLLNFYYGFTGGTKLFPQDRPFVGLDNFQTLSNCTDFLNPNSCTQHIFWRSIFTTSQEHTPALQSPSTPV